MCTCSQRTLWKLSHSIINTDNGVPQLPQKIVLMHTHLLHHAAESLQAWLMFKMPFTALALW